LAFFSASPDEYTVIFTANASGALRLVGESYPFAVGSQFLLTADNHNSVNGIREFARAREADVVYVPLRPPNLRHDPNDVLEALDRAPTGRFNLFAYPAQSNYSGVRHPLDWVSRAHDRGWDVLLDASAFSPTNSLDLSRWHPDFVAISWYKLFGYPTGIGSLVVRREALARLRRPWFAGGTIRLASVLVQRHTLGDDEVGFEDGTIDYLGLPAIEIGLRHLASVGMPTIHRHVQSITRSLVERMAMLRHRDGEPMIRLYGPTDEVDRGGTVAFNLLDSAGGVVDFWKVEASAADRRISVRTGCFCNPGASETARGLTMLEMDRVFALGRHASIEDLRRLLPGRALGAVRASVGIATTGRDISRFVAFLQDQASDEV
jgi:selenocysteine lyase/cysteine desulfurase